MMLVSIQKQFSTQVVTPETGRFNLDVLAY